MARKNEGAAAAAAAGTVEVRVLADTAEFKCGEVVSLTAEEAETAQAAGWGDTTPEAVAYAKSVLAEAAEPSAEAFAAPAAE